MLIHSRVCGNEIALMHIHPDRDSTVAIVSDGTTGRLRDQLHTEPGAVIEAFCYCRASPLAYTNRETSVVGFQESTS